MERDGILGSLLIIALPVFAPYAKLLHTSTWWTPSHPIPSSPPFFCVKSSTTSTIPRLSSEILLSFGPEIWHTFFWSFFFFFLCTSLLLASIKPRPLFGLDSLENRSYTMIPCFLFHLFPILLVPFFLFSVFLSWWGPSLPLQAVSLMKTSPL